MSSEIQSPAHWDKNACPKPLWRRRPGCIILLGLLAGPCAIEPCDGLARRDRLHREFREELQAGMSSSARRARWASGYPDLDIIALDDSISGAEFAERMRRIGGWSRVAVIGPYGMARRSFQRRRASVPGCGCASR